MPPPPLTNPLQALAQSTTLLIDLSKGTNVFTDPIEAAEETIL